MGLLSLVATQLSIGAALAMGSIAMVGITGHTHFSQWLLFDLCFGLFLPIAIVAGNRVAGAITRGSNAPAMPGLVAVGGVGLLFVLGTARVVGASGGKPGPVMLGGVVLWAVAVAIAVRRAASRARRFASLTALTRSSVGIVAAAALVAVLSALPFLPQSVLSADRLLLSLAVAGALALVVGRSRSGRWPRSLTLALEVGVLIATVLAVIDVSMYLQDLPYAGSIGGPFRLNRTQLNFIQQVHSDFYLAPVNDVLHGRAMLVDTYSQYGNGVVYFLAAFFKLAPLGYGAFGLLVGTVTALQYAVAYLVLRLAGCRAVLATAAVALAVVVCAYGFIGSAALLPSLGGLRFGLGYLLILAVVCAARWPQWGTRGRVVQLAIVGVSAAWSIETMIYVVATYVAVAGFEAATLPLATHSRWLRFGRDVAHAAVCCLGAIVLLSVGTLAVAGRWPDWSPYLAVFTAYSGSKVGGIGLGFIQPWATGYCIGAIYFASALGLFALIGRRHPLVQRTAAMVALVATTAFGVATFTYWASHSTLQPIAIPAVILGALWLDVLIDLDWSAGPAVRFAAIAIGLWLAVLPALFTWPQVRDKWRQSALWHAVPGHGLRYAVRDLWRSPPLHPQAIEAEALVRRRFPGRGPVLMLTDPDLAVETLMRTRRVNLMPLGDVLQDNLLRQYVLPRVRGAVDRIKPGTLMLVQRRSNPRVNAEVERQTPLELSTLDYLRRRFEMRVIEATPTGLAVLRLSRRRA